MFQYIILHAFIALTRLISTKSKVILKLLITL